MNHTLLAIMQNDDIRKAFGARLKNLRKKKKLTQKELAEKINVRFPQLNKYECGLHAPPLITHADNITHRVVSILFFQSRV